MNRIVLGILSLTLLPVSNADTVPAGLRHNRRMRTDDPNTTTNPDNIPLGSLPGRYDSVTLGTGLGGCSGTQEAVLDVYRSDDHEAAVTVLHLPGGAYLNLVGDTIDSAGASYVAAGYTLAVLSYRLPRSPTEKSWLVCSDNPGEAVEDVGAALTLLRDRAEEYRVDTDRIVLSGFSAGGHLAALYGSTCGTIATSSICPRATVLHFPFLEKGARIFCTASGSAFANNNEDYAACFPTALADAATPPTVLYQADGDTVVPAADTRDYVQALSDRGVAHEYYEVPGGGHFLVDFAQVSAADDEGRLDEGRKSYAALIERALGLPSPTNDCSRCDDVPTDWMVRHGKRCDREEWSVQNRCHEDPTWVEAGYCRYSCSEAGRGYDDDNDNDRKPCCTKTEDATPQPPPSPACTSCNDVPTSYMLDNDQICATATFAIQNNCNGSDWWVGKQFCQLSCQAAGRGYPDLNCC